MDLGIEWINIREYVIYSIYAIMCGALIAGFGKEHPLLVKYCIIGGLLILIAYIWESD